MKVPMEKQRYPVWQRASTDEVLRAIIEFLDLEFYRAIDPSAGEEARERLRCHKREKP